MARSTRTGRAFSAPTALLTALLLGGCLMSDPVETPDTPVAAPNQAPEISGRPSDNVMSGETYTFMPQSSDADGDELSFAIRNKPAWMKFNQKTGRLSGTPTASDVGVTTNIRISTSDGELSASLKPFEIEVFAEPAEPPPPPAPTPPPSSDTPKKYNPGHYIAMNRSDDHADMMTAVKPGVKGFQIRYYWRELEPAFDVYDFSKIRKDLKFANSQGMKLVVFVFDKTFDSRVPTPGYLRGEHTLENRKGGYTAKRWSPFVVQRFSKLMRKLGQEFDKHPAFEGVAIQETSLGLDGKSLDAANYSAIAYRNALVDVLMATKNAFPRSQVFWYMNFIPRGQDRIVEVANAVRKSGIIMGGPDVLPDDDALARLTYPIYDDFKGRMKLFNSLQFNSFNHVHAEKNKYKTKYWTLKELANFAKNELHVSYLFWNRKTWRQPDDSYSITDAYPVIGNNPRLNN